jgi:hypothetical protein
MVKDIEMTEKRTLKVKNNREPLIERFPVSPLFKAPKHLCNKPLENT